MTAADVLAEAEAKLAEVEAEAAERRERLAQVEAGGLSVTELRQLSDQVQLSDPAELDTARIAVAEARIPLIEQALAERFADREAAQAALDEALPVLQAAQQAVAAAQNRILASFGHDLKADLREAQGDLARVRSAAEAAAAVRWRQLAGLPEPAVGQGLVEIRDLGQYGAFDTQGPRRAERPVQDGFMQHADVVITPRAG